VLYRQRAFGLQDINLDPLCHGVALAVGASPDQARLDTKLSYELTIRRNSESPQPEVARVSLPNRVRHFHRCYMAGNYRFLDFGLSGDLSRLWLRICHPRETRRPR
jgi:hypothetical protein